MKGSIHVRRSVAFGSLALVALGAGCSREQSTRAATPSPTFESRAPETTSEPQSGSQAQGTEPGTMTPPSAPQQSMPGMQPSPGSMPGMQQPSSEGTTAPGRVEPPSSTASPGAGSMGMGQQGSMGMGQQGSSMGMGQQGSMPQGGGETTSTPNERALCDSLSQDANMRVEDIQGGVAIVLTPRSGKDLDAVRNDARGIERSLSPGTAGSSGRTQPTGEGRCDLMEIGRQGATTSVIEGPSEVRILMTSPDATASKNLRKQVRDYVRSSTKAGGAKP